MDSIEKLTTTIQRNLIENPTLLVGSGGSVPYGLPSMSALASEIIEKLTTRYRDEDTWKAFIAELESSNNLESALEKISLKEDIQRSIISTVWAFIDRKDREAITEFLTKGTSPTLTPILKKFVQRAGSTNIITTNYDRLIEYSIDISQGTIENGFSGNCVKNFCNFSKSAGKRIINLYKVHGSVDWFRHNTGDLLSTNFLHSKHIPDVYTPMIVTPGNGKYRETHNDPFRTVMAEADKALRSAGSYLCIGYGFNDDHIQPIIIDENRNRNKAIVIVTKSVTPKMRDLFLQKTTSNCLIIAENVGGGSIVHYSDRECETFKENFWCLDSFYKLWLE